MIRNSHQTRGLKRCSQDLRDIPPIDFGAPGSQMLEQHKFGTETEAEKHMKALLEKQLDTKITIKDHFAQHRNFTTSSTYVPLTELVHGTCSLENYKCVEEHQEKLQELQQSGLTQEEINFYFSNESTDGSKKGFQVDPVVHKEKLEKIKEKIEAHEKELTDPVTFAGVKTLSRHAMDIEKTLYAGCRTKNLYLNSLITEKSKSIVCDSDPFSHIKDLSEKLTQKIHREWKSKKRRKTKLAADEENDVTEISQETEKSNFVYNPNVHHVIVPLEEGDVLQQKLTVEEIQKLPKFENYKPGHPNKVLYLKNLHPKVTTQELQALFGTFEIDSPERLEYRVLTGKMKGQAFVTFPDVSTAEKALTFANGYMLRNRPLIIQYGRKSF